MDSFALYDAAAHLRKIPDKPIPATDRLRLAWHLVADAFRHPHLRGEQFAELRELVTPMHHVRYSEPISFMQFATAVSDDPAAYGDAINSTGFRDEVCNRAIQAVADWIDAESNRVDQDRAAGYLALTVDESQGEVRRQGFPDAVHFEPGSAAWHMFLSAWQAGEGGVTQEQMSIGYPGDPTPRARKDVKQHANTLLASLQVRLAPNRPPMLEPIS